MNEEEPLTAIHAPQIAQESGKNEVQFLLNSYWIKI